MGSKEFTTFDSEHVAVTSLLSLTMTMQRDKVTVTGTTVLAYFTECTTHLNKTIKES